MRNLLRTRIILKTLAIALIGFQLSACSGSQPKEDEPVVEQQKAEDELLAEKMGMSVETVRAFQEAIAEQEKKRPDNDKAEELLLQVVQAEPEFTAAHYNLGVLYSNMNRYEDAVKHIEIARDLAPGDLSHTAALAQAYAVTEQYDKAQQLLEEVIAREPDNLTAKNNLAVLAIKADEDEKAMQYVQEVLRENNENVGALNSLGLIYTKQNNVSLAKYVFTKAIKLSEENPDPDIHNNLGLVYMSEDDVPAAVNEFEAANEVDENYLESRLNLGSILIEYLDYERAVEQFEQAVRIDPAHCVAHLGLAASSYGAGEGEDAAREFKYYLERCDEGHLSSHQRLAKLYETTLADPGQAAQYYEKLIGMVDDEDQRNEYEAMANFLKNEAESGDQKDAEPEEEQLEEDQQPEEPAEQDGDS